MRKIPIFLIITGLTLGGCCNEDFIMPDYDFFEYALDVTARIDAGCTLDAAYTTEGETPDGNTCNDSPLHNRWFKFQSPYSYIYVIVYVGGAEGTQRKTHTALWDVDDPTSLACEFYGADDDDVFLYYSGLTPGEWYYFSVDVGDSQSVGTFSLCLYTD